MKIDVPATSFFAFFGGCYLYTDSYWLSLLGASAVYLSLGLVCDLLKRDGQSTAATDATKDVQSAEPGELIDGPHDPAPYGGVIWDDEYTIDELIYKDGKYYINEHSEEWEEDEEDC